MLDSQEEGYCYPKECHVAVKKSVKQIDCTTGTSRCKGQTCELNEICAEDSELESYCFPKECASLFDIKQKKVKQDHC